MRILHLINDAATGGAQTLVEALAASRLPEDEVHVAVLQGEDILSARLHAVSDSVTHFNAPKTALAVPQMLFRLLGTIGGLRPDVLHSHLFQSDILSAIAPVGRTARVSTVHTSSITTRDPRLSRVNFRLLTRLSRRFDCVVPCNDSARRLIVSSGYRHVGPTIDNGTRVPARPTPRKPEKTLLCLARFHPMKGHNRLLEAFAEFHRDFDDWGLILGGSGVEKSNSELRKLIDQHPSIRHAVRILGPVRDIDPLMQSARALVIASTYGEALPMVGIEALARGLPVVTTAVGGCSALALDEQLVVPPGDSRALAEAMRTVASLPSPAYRALCNASHQRAQRDFDINVQVARYRKVYEQVTSRRRDVN